MMKALLLAALVGLLHAEVVVKHLQVYEGATDYTQTVTLDFERNIQILEVPAHNNIVHSKTIFDFNQGVLFESHPETSTCFIKDLNAICQKAVCGKPARKERILVGGLLTVPMSLMISVMNIWSIAVSSIIVLLAKLIVTHATTWNVLTALNIGKNADLLSMLHTVLVSAQKILNLAKIAESFTAHERLMVLVRHGIVLKMKG